MEEWRNENSIKFNMDECKVLPMGWKSFHSICGYIKKRKASRLRELIIPFPIGACEVAHEVLWLVFRDWQTGTSPEKDYYGDG